MILMIMNENPDKDRLITDIGIREYFHNRVISAVEHQDKDITPETIFYVVNLLMDFSHTEKVFGQNSQGNSVQSLALMYAEALEASSREEQIISLKQLGDVSLFIAGLFSYSLNRSLVDVDYYIAMGGSAYSYLANNIRDYNRKTFCEIYNELAEKFLAMVDVLSEVGDNMNHHSDRDIMRLYEVWEKTHSRLAADKLRHAGIEPVRVGGAKH